MTKVQRMFASLAVAVGGAGLFVTMDAVFRHRHVPLFALVCFVYGLVVALAISADQLGQKMAVLRLEKARPTGAHMPAPSPPVPNRGSEVVLPDAVVSRRNTAVELRRPEVSEEGMLNQFRADFLAEMSALANDWIPDDSLPDYWFFIVLGEQKAGYCCVRKVDKRTFQLQELFVRPDYRNRGVATETLTHLTRFLSMLGATDLNVQLTGVVTAQTFFQKRAAMPSLQLNVTIDNGSP